jgi:hypothetical protein
MIVDSTDVARALVDKLYPSGAVSTKAYGPYAGSTSCRDMEPHGARPTRVRKQKLTAWADEDYYGTPDSGLTWKTIKTTYTNGGEDVEWDD